MISNQGFTWSNFPYQVHSKTAIHMQMTSQGPFLEAQNFHHKLQILVEAIIACKTSSDTHCSHDITCNMKVFLSSYCCLQLFFPLLVKKHIVP
jgi:hypothetical protein